MAVRQSYQFNAPSGNGGGLIMQNSADLKFWNAANAALRWGVDSDFTDRLRIGDSLLSGAPHLSMPVVPYGGFGLVGRNVSGAVAVTADDAVLRCDTTAGNCTLNLPPAADMENQFLDIMMVAGGNNIIIDPSGAELINFQATLTFNQYESGLRIRSNGVGWEVFKDELKLRTLIVNDNPVAASAGALVDVQASASLYYSGRPVMFLFTGAARNVNGGVPEFMQAEFSIRIDAGAQNRICQWDANLDGDHRMTSGFVVLTPAQGGRVITLSIQRTTGAGTFTLDANDWVRLYSIEL